MGSKSSLKKVSRKAILGVDVVKACQTIENPEVPLALRLQGNLLYGVTRVYSEQCGYVLNDTEHARNGMKALFRVAETNTLSDIEGHRGRAEHLMLPDDVSMLPDFDLLMLNPGETPDVSQATLLTRVESQLSNLSPHNSQLQATELEAGAGLEFPPSVSSTIEGNLQPFGRPDGSQTPKRSGLARMLLPDDDLGLQIESDGSLRLEDNLLRAPEATGVKDGIRAAYEINRELATRASSQELKQEPRTIMGGVGDIEPNAQNLAEDYDEMSDPILPVIVGPQMHSSVTGAQQVTSEESASANFRGRKPPRRKILPLDRRTELQNKDIARWSEQYTTKMARLSKAKNAQRSATQAKKNAEFWVLGYMNQSDRGPLNMFQGAQLLKALTGIDYDNPFQSIDKRPAEDELGSDRSKRSRGEPSSELDRGVEYTNIREDDPQPVMEEDAVERGRRQPTPLEETRHLSSMFPWNQSATGSRHLASLPGSQQNLNRQFSATASGGERFSGSGIRSRFVSQSPLTGRGEAVTGNDFQLPSGIDLTGDEAFELFGPAVDADSQSGEESQWKSTLHDPESLNFLAFLKDSIAQTDVQKADFPDGNSNDLSTRGSIEFETLLPSQSNSYVVAAQALVHTLALGTKNLIAVVQEQPFTTITLRTLG